MFFMMRKKIKELDSYIRPVKTLYYDLLHIYSGSHQILKILQMKYFHHDNLISILEELHISQPTYWRRTQELMKLAKKYFGLD